ncbi:MAG: hypothetical protein ACI9G1_001746 [Pirellulaceae bacterium]|jgi:hypothetical protein
MADFNTHITTSTIVGIGYGLGGFYFGVPLPCVVLSAGLCSLAGIIPDLDSDSGKPVREIFAAAAAMAPLMLADRFRQLGFDHEYIVMAGLLLYLIIRFGVSAIFKRYTVHRGMWHSIPACATTGLLTYLMVYNHSEQVRFYLTGASVLGFLVHLTLDEIWSIEFKGIKIRLKSSSGTALKFYSKSAWANFSTYAKMIALTCYVIFADPVLMEKFKVNEAHQTARDKVNEVIESTEPLWR